LASARIMSSWVLILSFMASRFGCLDVTIPYVDQHDKKDLYCFLVLVLVIVGLWGGGIWIAFH
jgi:hypothetical protein